MRNIDGVSIRRVRNSPGGRWWWCVFQDHVHLRMRFTIDEGYTRTRRGAQRQAIRSMKRLCQQEETWELNPGTDVMWERDS